LDRDFKPRACGVSVLEGESLLFRLAGEAGMV